MLGIEVGTRVAVRDGHNERDLGEGVYLGDVTMFFALMQNDAEEQFMVSGESEAALDAQVDLARETSGAIVLQRGSGDTPKIQLKGDGAIIYGSQCWWEPIE